MNKILAGVVVIMFFMCGSVLGAEKEEISVKGSISGLQETLQKYIAEVYCRPAK